MVRPKKVMAGIRAKEEESDNALMVQSRSRRTIKPNPKYNSKEMIPLKRLDSGDEGEDDDDNDASMNTEDDEDFQDDGAKDSDIEESPRVRKRGRPRASEAPRSEPQPQRGRLQQIRAGLKEATMSASKIMQHSAFGSLDKKRKIEFDSNDDDDAPNVKRRAGVASSAAATPTRGTSRIVSTSTTTRTVTSGKENTSMLKKAAEVQAKPVKVINKNAGQTPPATKTVTPGITTRKQQASPSTPAAGIVRVQSAVGKETPSRSMIQVRRPTPMSSQTSPASAAIPISPVPAKVATKERVILNRTPALKPKPAVPLVVSSAGASPTTPSPRVVSTRGQVTIKSSPAAAAVINSKPNVHRVLNKQTAPLSPLTSPKSLASGFNSAAEGQMLGDNKLRVTSIETRYVVRVPPEEDSAVGDEESDTPFISLLNLRRDIKSLKMPTDLWSYQMKLHARRGEPDASQDVPDKPGYVVHSVILNRVVPPTTAPKLLNGQKVDLRQYDRSVELLRNHYNVSIDGRSVKLVGSPSVVANIEDVETLLQIVDKVTIDSPVVKSMFSV